ncbi:hypothetical protein PT974_00795 [Cladobotryum mycophilum]|uniref:C2H2-type domain-containing protein n=1 Tax=Cladobotryum mycophilum TaxID=491253 RepID=A0ABR0T3A2_9HYPO
MSIVGCSCCPLHFDSETEFKEHIRGSQDRASAILQELHQIRAFQLLQELRQCVAHSTTKSSQAATRETSVTSSPGQAKGQSKITDHDEESFECPHPECFNKIKTPFTRRKDLVRHFAKHVRCRERCLFCRCDIDLVRKYATHYDICKARQSQVEQGTLSSHLNIEAIKTRRRLGKLASEELDYFLGTASIVFETQSLSDEESLPTAQHSYGGVSLENMSSGFDFNQLGVGINASRESSAEGSSSHGGTKEHPLLTTVNMEHVAPPDPLLFPLDLTTNSLPLFSYVAGKDAIEWPSSINEVAAFDLAMTTQPQAGVPSQGFSLQDQADEQSYNGVLLENFMEF